MLTIGPHRKSQYKSILNLNRARPQSAHPTTLQAWWLQPLGEVLPSSVAGCMASFTGPALPLGPGFIYLFIYFLGPEFNKSSELPVVFRLNVGSNLCQDSGSRWGSPSPLHMRVYSYLGWDKLVSFYNSEGPHTGMWSLLTLPQTPPTQPGPYP